MQVLRPIRGKTVSLSKGLGAHPETVRAHIKVCSRIIFFNILHFLLLVRDLLILTLMIILVVVV
jgi:hypothetical protein